MDSNKKKIILSIVGLMAAISILVYYFSSQQNPAFANNAILLKCEYCSSVFEISHKELKQYIIETGKTQISGYECPKCKKAGGNSILED